VSVPTELSLSARLATCGALAALAVLAPAAIAGAAEKTPGGWTVASAGHQILLSPAATGFQGPLGTAISPAGNLALSVASGAARFQTADLFDLNSGARSSSIGYDGRLGESVFFGVVFSPDGTRAWASGGGENVVHAYTVNGDQLTPAGDIPAPWFPAGLAYGRTPLGDRIYVANNLSGPAGATNPPGGSVTVIDPATNTVTGTIDLGVQRAPLAVAFERRGIKAYVTNWLGRSVTVINTATQQVKKTLMLSPQSDPLQADHPAAIAANPARDQVYVANANSDTVSVIDSRRDRLAATLNVGLAGRGPTGATPTGLAVSPNGRTLYVSLGGENAVEVIDLKSRRRLGLIPVGWYPTDVDVTPDGSQLVVTNTNGSGSHANPCGPRSPLSGCDTGEQAPDFNPETESVKTMVKGSLSVIPAATSKRQLAGATAAVMRYNRVRARHARKPAFLRAIKHVIFVIKENRTYDQVLGDIGRGNSDPSLTLFDSTSAPNHHELARRFTLFDNFYSDAQVSADGHDWLTGAIATDYVEKTWPFAYSPGVRNDQRAYDFEAVDPNQVLPSEPLSFDPRVARPAAAPTDGYLWDNAFRHGVSFRDYGEFTRGPPGCTGGGNSSNVTHLSPRYGNHVDRLFPGFDLGCSDSTVREPEWQREFTRFDQEHVRALAAFRKRQAQRRRELAVLRRHHKHRRLPPLRPPRDPLPALELVRFPNDHTNGTRPGTPTPEAYVADNDLAFGNLVQAVSHSSYWRSTAIVVTEDDSQDGPDHVDAHRTLAYVISPYTQHGGVDSHQYDDASLLATIEGLLGLPPMSIADARAPAMWPAFSRAANTTPYTRIQPQVTPFGAGGFAVNSASAPMARASSTWDFRDAERAPDVALNQAIWKSVKGARSKMPAPRHTLVGSAAVPGDGG
jgi:YVTN family beta-propeller protein